MAIQISQPLNCNLNNVYFLTITLVRAAEEERIREEQERQRLLLEAERQKLLQAEEEKRVFELERAREQQQRLLQIQLEESARFVLRSLVKAK